jgi:hypothetical protein
MKNANLDTMRTEQALPSMVIRNTLCIIAAFCKRPETGNAYSHLPIILIAQYQFTKNIRRKAEPRSSEGNGKSYDKKSIQGMDGQELGKEMP